MVGETGIRHAMTQHNGITQSITELGGNLSTKHHIIERVKPSALTEPQRLLSPMLVSFKELRSRANYPKTAVGIAK